MVASIQPKKINKKKINRGVILPRDKDAVKRLLSLPFLFSMKMKTVNALLHEGRRKNNLLDDDFWVGHKIGDAFEHAPGFEDKGREGDAMEVTSLCELGDEVEEDAAVALLDDLGVVAVGCGVVDGICHCFALLVFC